jgi:hypothetical protein
MTKRPPQPDCYDYVRRYYGVPANVGQRVKVNGKGEGVLVGKQGSQQYVWIRFDGETRVNGPFHPTDGVEYMTA